MVTVNLSLTHVKNRSTVESLARTRTRTCSVTVERAISNSIGVVAERLIEATRDAAEEGLIKRRRIDPLPVEIAAAASARPPMRRNFAGGKG